MILEAGNGTAEPGPGYLEGVRALCDAHRTVLVLDETITGFHWSEHSAQHVYGVTPDLSCWGKANRLWPRRGRWVAMCRRNAVATHNEVSR